MVTVKAIRALRELASWDKSRYQMRALKLESTGEIVACDGRIMGIVKREQNGSPLKDAMLQRDALDTILKIAPKDGMIDLDSGSAFGLPLAEEEGRYPDWKRAVPEDAESDERIHLSLGVPLLQSLLDACKVLGASCITFKVKATTTEHRINSVVSAIPFSVFPKDGGELMSGILMPLVVQREPKAAEAP